MIDGEDNRRAWFQRQRRWLRPHLSTMLLFSALAACSTLLETAGQDYADSGVSVSGPAWFSYGWPWTFATCASVSGDRWRIQGEPIDFFPGELAADVSVVLAGCFLMAVAWEAHVRRSKNMFSFSLRSMFALLAVVCLALGWLRMEWRSWDDERLMIESVGRAGLQAHRAAVEARLARREIKEPLSNDIWMQEPTVHFHKRYCGPLWLARLAGRSDRLPEMFQRVTEIQGSEIQAWEIQGLVSSPPAIKALDYRVFKHCRSIKDNEANNEVLLAICELPRLDSLTLRNPKIDNAGFDALARMRSLTSLRLTICSIGDRDAAAIANLRTIRFLRLESVQISNSAMRQLYVLVNVERFSLANSTVSDAGLAGLNSLARLELLDLSGTTVTDNGLLNLSGLTKLTDLSLENTMVTGSRLREITGLGNLRTLNLTNARFNDAQVGGLAGMPSLSVISLANTAFTDAGLARLPPLPTLRDIDLAGTSVTDEGLTHLLRYPQLATISLANTGVTIDGLRQLEPLESLHRIDALGTKVQQKEIDTLPDSALKRAIITN